MASIDEVAACLRLLPGLRLAIIFGSMSAGRAGPDSDLDVAVAAEQALSAEQKIAWMAELARLAGRPVDLVDLRTAGQPLLTQVLTKGRLVYCVDRGLYAELIKRMMFDQADFVPYQQRILDERRRAWIGS